MPKLAKWEKDNNVAMRKHIASGGETYLYSVRKPESRDEMSNRDWRERLHDAGIPSDGPHYSVYVGHTCIRVMSKHAHKANKILY